MVLLALITFVAYTGDIASNVQHLFFLSFTTFIIYAYQVSLNEQFSWAQKLKWCVLIFFIPSLFSLLYWYKYINKDSEE